MRAFMSHSATSVPCARSGELLELSRAARDVCGDRLPDRRIKRGRGVLGEQLLPDAGRAHGGVAAPGLCPALEVRPVREQRAVEGRLVARERVRRAEEMPAGGDLLDRLD